MGPSIKISKDVSPAGLLHLLKQKIERGNWVVRVGLPDNDNAARGDMTLAKLGSILEYGTATIPPRPFLETGVRLARDEIAKVSAALLESVIKGKRTLTDALSVVGAIAVRTTQAKIAEGGFAPNAERTIERKGKRTIERKGSSKPLIDTGHLRQSITFQVVGKEV